MEEGGFISSVTVWIANSNGPVGNTDFAVELFPGLPVSSSGTPAGRALFWHEAFIPTVSSVQIKPLIASMLVKQS